MVKALFDTNILIDYLHAVPDARTEIDRFTDRAISIVSWMEVMVGAEATVEPQTRAFLDGFTLLPVNGAIAECAVILRRENRIKLPDAIIWASARITDMLLVTRNSRDFPVSDPGIRIPYRL